MPCDITKTSSEIEHVDWSTGTGSGHHYTNVRFGSGSSQASQSSGDICRICHCESDPQNPLLTPCYCAGSLKYVHQTCLQQWLTASETNSCELCKFPFIMHTKIKPFNEWRSLDISGIERRRLCCTVLFHILAALCVIWSLCVLIERTAEDVKNGAIDWPFWTKLAVVTVGLTGVIVFMYIQCKQYLHLCHRWKARNRILLIQNAPEKIHPLSPPSPAGQHRSRHVTTINEPHTSASAAAALASGTAGGCNSAISNAEIAGNMSAATSSPYSNYATQVGGNSGIGGGGVISGVCIGSGAGAGVGGMAGNQMLIVGDGNVGLHHHHHHHNHHHQSHLLASSPHHMLQQTDLDISSLNARSFAADPRNEHGQHGQHLPTQHHHQLGQVAVAANIECSQSQNNYERDWALDDVVSQISSFRPCPQGSGSMTPFHDSIHNVLEHSEDSSRVSTNDLCIGSRQDLSTGGISTDTGREHALQLSSFSGSGDHKAPSISSGVSHAVANGLGGFVYKPHTKRYSNSSIFLENRDILNDSVALGLETTYDYPKIDYRHSSILTPPDGGEQYFGRDVRRHSDTKLLGSVDADVHDPMLYGAAPDDITANVIPAASPADGSIHLGAGDAVGASSSTAMTAARSISNNENSTSKRIRQLLKQRSATEVDTVHDIELPATPLSSPPDALLVGARRQHQQQTNRQHAQLGYITHTPQTHTYAQRQMLSRSFDLVDANANGDESYEQLEDDSSINVPFVDGHANNMRHEQLQLQQQRQHAQTQQQCQQQQQHQQQQQQIERSRIFFKSLPNLSRSRESLLKK